MKTYQFESVIQENGVIILPEHLKRLYNHKVKLIVFYLEILSDSPLNILKEITDRYGEIDEADLDIRAIYKQREEADDREIVFD
jgi:hypothetical protein